MDWHKHYPANAAGTPVQFLDLGCGYGGMLSMSAARWGMAGPPNDSTAVIPAAVKLAAMFPAVLSLGMEIRVKVSDYVRDRIAALRL